MASSHGVWGIDVGQCALKALRCTVAEDGQTVVADAFDYIEYPKILSQPEADPDELIRDALQQFLSRNDVRGDKVAISVSGQAGLSRFIKLPPVESKKIPDIVKYEARQQIPFPLEEVIWDYQQLAGGSEEEGFTLETEVGLFAMKREQVFKVIRPFDRADMELDIIQLAPLSIYNVVCHDYLHDLPPPDEYDPDNPPESVVVISLGTDTSDLVVTNGYRVWQRNIPLGGNHFTRALTKELKLTFAKAEHLKRNARDAEDPKKVFQAMRPVFNDLVTEVQRSISYFQSIDRRAKIGKVIALGNAMRLPGLQQYLSKNLGYDVVEVKGYQHLSGKGVVGAPAFRENLLSYAVCYGLCLQGLNKAALSTNLIPRELIIQRMVREKKPWALAAVAVLLLGLAFNFFFINGAWKSVNVERNDYVAAMSAVTQVKQRDTSDTQTDATLLENSEYLKSLGDEVVDNSERRLFWPEIFTAVNAALPHNPVEEYIQFDPNATNPANVRLDYIFNVKDVPLDQRMDIHVHKIESERFADLATWYTEEVQKRYSSDQRAIAGEPEEAAADADPAADPAAAPADAAAADGAPPSGEGWVIEIQGWHDFAKAGSNQGAKYVRDSIVKNFGEGSVALPTGPGKEKRVFKLKEFGITYPVVIWDSTRPMDVTVTNPNLDTPEAGDGRGLGVGAAEAEEDPANQKDWILERFYFIVQVAVTDETISERIKKLDEQNQGTAAAGNQVAAKGY